MSLREEAKHLRERIQAERWLGFGVPIVLFFAALVTWVSPTNVGLVTGLVGGTVSGAFAMYLVLFRQGTVRLSWVTATGLLLGYAGGALNTNVGLMRQGTNLAEYFGRLQSDLSFAAAIVLWLCSALFIGGGMLEPPLAIRRKRLSKSDARLVWIAIGLVGLCFVTGHLVFNGMQETSDNHITVLGDFGSFFCGILPGMTMILFSASKWRRRTKMLVVLVFLELGLLILLGRRIFIYGIVVSCLSASLAGLRPKMSLIKKALFAAAAVATIYTGMRFFYAMRVVHWGLNGGSLTQIVSGAIKMVTDETDTSLNEALAKNVRDRTSIIIYLSDVLAASKVYPPLYGKDFVYSVEWAIPSVIYPEKNTAAEEVLTNPQFGMAIDDDPNSVLTSGTSDFGVFGCCAYPVLIIIVFRIVLGVLRSRLSEASFAVALVAVLTLLFQAEAGLAEHTTMVREMVLMAILINILKKWPAIRSKKAESEKLLSLRLGGPRQPMPAQS